MIGIDLNQRITSFISDRVSKLGLNKTFTLGDMIEYGNRSTALGQAWTSFKLRFQGKGTLNDEKFLEINKFIQKSDAPQQVKSAVKVNHVQNLLKQASTTVSKNKEAFSNRFQQQQTSWLSDLFQSFSFAPSSNEIDRENLYTKKDVEKAKSSEPRFNVNSEESHIKQFMKVWGLDIRLLPSFSESTVKLWCNSAGIQNVAVYTTDDIGQFISSKEMRNRTANQNDLQLSPNCFKVSVDQNGQFKVRCKLLNKGIEGDSNNSLLLTKIAEGLEKELNANQKLS